MTKILVYFGTVCFLIEFFACLHNQVPDTFHVRHYNGKCLEFRTNKLAFSSVCRDHFRWKGGARLVHVRTKRCLVPQSDQAGGRMTLTSSCSSTDTIFQNKPEANVIKHLMTGKCISPVNETKDPADDTELVLRTGCDRKMDKFWLVPQVLYTIRHSGGLCWKYVDSDNLIRLQNEFVCDRFYQQDSKHLRHWRTGKCVIFKNSYLRLVPDCSSPDTIFYLDSKSLLHQTATKCVHPYLGNQNPAAGTPLVLHRCSDDDRIRTYFYDDKQVLKINLISESCNDVASGAGCGSAKGYIKVNGYQYSNNRRGFNIAVFDYRSGLLEHRSDYDVYGNSNQRDALATFLNSLPADKILFMTVQNAVVQNLGSYLPQALRKRGVSSTFASTNLPSARCTMATVAFTGKNRKDWEESVSSSNCVGKSTLQKNIFVFRDFKGVDECTGEMGMRTGKISDSQTSASSEYRYTPSDIAHLSYQSRLHQDVGWCAARGSSISNYLQIDLGAKQMLTGLAIQGHSVDGGHAVSYFKLQHSMDGVTWKYYVDDSNTVKVFKGLPRVLVKETATNWFSRTFLRFIRIIPTARLTTSSGTHCIRMELFGCPAKGPMFTQNIFSSRNVSIADERSGVASFHGISPLDKKAEVSISIAAYNTTLEHPTDQLHLVEVDSKITTNGNVVKNAANTTRMKNPDRGITRAVRVDCKFNASDYHSLNIAIKNKILDTERESGLTAWNVYSYETSDQSLVISSPLKISRRKKDRSLLLYEITKKTKEEFGDGEEFNFNMSISHLPKSNSNAYKLQLFIYYDTNFLTLQSFSNIARDNFTIAPTRNSSSPGILHFQTDKLWLLNSHFLQFKFKFNFPSQIAKGDNCAGAVITEYTYTDNLAKYKGKLNTTTRKEIAYKCKYPTEHIIATSGRLTVPGFSMLFDDVNNDVYVCKKRTKYSGLPSCFMQESGKASWRAIPYIVSIVGIDTGKRVLFGIGHHGNGYARIDRHLKTAKHVHDDEWTSIQSQPNVRKAKTAIDTTSLPTVPENAWKFSSSSVEIWAATNTGVMKKGTSSWKRAMLW